MSDQSIEKASMLVLSSECLKYRAEITKKCSPFLSEALLYGAFILELNAQKLLKVKPFAVCECGRICGSKKSFVAHSAVCKNKNQLKDDH